MNRTETYGIRYVRYLEKTNWNVQMRVNGRYLYNSGDMAQVTLDFDQRKAVVRNTIQYNGE